MTTSSPSKKNDVRFDVTTGALPSSRKTYVKGQVHKDVNVAMREIILSASSGELPLAVYDTSGAYTDTNQSIDIHKGLPKLRESWVLGRGDVEAYDGRPVKPEDNGLKGAHLGAPVSEFPHVNAKPLRAKAGKNVTQMHYARAGIVTQEM